MDGLADIKNFAELWQKFRKLDTSNNGRISHKEVPDDVEKYDRNDSSSVELWEYMEAVNQASTTPVFSSYAVDASKKAYQLLSISLSHLKTKNDCPMILVSGPHEENLTTVDDAGNIDVHTASLLFFLHEHAPLGQDKARLFGLLDFLFCLNTAPDPCMYDALSSLLRIGATNEEIFRFLNEDIPGYFLEEIPLLVDQALKLGLNKDDIFGFLAALVDRYSKISESMNYIVLRQKIRDNAHGDPVPFNKLRQLGFSDRQIVALFHRYLALKEVEIGTVSELLAAGFSPQQVVDYITRVGPLSPELPTLVTALLSAGFKLQNAVVFLLDNNRDEKQIVADIVTALATDGTMKPAAISRFFHDLPALSLNKHTAGIVKQCLANVWQPEKIIELLVFLTSMSKQFSTTTSLDVSRELLDALRRSPSSPEAPPQDTLGVSLHALPRLRSKISPKDLENYLLPLFSLAAFQKNVGAVKQVAAEAAALKTGNHQLNLIMNLAGQEKLKIETVTGTPYARVLRINGITLIARKESPDDTILIPGAAKFHGRQVTVTHFNRKNFTAIFEYPEENIGAATALLEGVNMLPEDFFNSFDAGRPLRIVFRTAKDQTADGWYSPNEVVVDMTDGPSLGTIVHELAHHWDMSLTIGFDGRQNSAGDPSPLHYGISWTPERIAREVEGGLYMKKQPDRSGFDKNDFARDYGLANRYEDLATMFEHYVTNGTALRSSVRENMKKGNFELAVKYLFVKHLAPFRGREYGLNDKDKGLTFEAVDAAIAAASNKSATESATFNALAEIRNRTEQAGSY